MIVPKRKQSKCRGRKRRTHWKLSNPALSVCSHCGQPKEPHRLCLSCGYYRNKQIIHVEA